MSKEEEFLLKWNNHQNNLVGVFKDWLKDESFVDITLVCGGEIVLGHKVVLAACSPLLSNILHKNPCTHPIIILNDVPSSDMRALLNFIYHGEVSVSQAELPSFLRTADNLQIKGLAEEKRKKDDDKKRKESDECPGPRKKSKSEHRNICHYQKSHKKKQDNSSGNRKLTLLNDVETSQILAIAGSNSNRKDSDETMDDSIDYDANREIFFGKKDLGLCEENAVIKTEPVEYSQESLLRHGRSSPAKYDDSSEEATVVHRAPYRYYNSVENNQLTSASNPYAPLTSITGSNDSFHSSALNDNEKNEEDLDLSGNLEENQSDDVQEVLDNDIIIGSGEDFNEDDQMCLGNSPAKFRGGRKPCCFCGKTFCDNYTLRRHMVTHLTKQRQFECSLCSAAYSRKDHLMAHVRRKHLPSDYEVEVSAKSS